MTTHYCESCFVVLCSETEILMLPSLTVDNFLALVSGEEKGEKGRFMLYKARQL